MRNLFFPERTRQLRSPRARRARGAALVEAAIVISLLTLGLMGVIFFRAFYVHQLQAARLARASILAHAMGGCAVEPSSWLLQPDRKDFTVSPANTTKETSPPGETSQGSATANGASSFLEGLLPDGGVYADMTFSNVAGNVTLTTKQGILSPKKTAFSSKVQSQSHIACGEVPKDGDFSEFLREQMGKLLGLIG